MRLASAGLALLALATSASAQAPPAGRAKVDAEPKLAVAVLAPAGSGQVRAVVRLAAVPEGLKVVADATGLPASARSNLILLAALES